MRPQYRDPWAIPQEKKPDKYDVSIIQQNGKFMQLIAKREIFCNCFGKNP